MSVPAVVWENQAIIWKNPWNSTPIGLEKNDHLSLKARHSQTVWASSNLKAPPKSLWKSRFTEKFSPKGWKTDQWRRFKKSVQKSVQKSWFYYGKFATLGIRQGIFTGKYFGHFYSKMFFTLSNNTISDYRPTNVNISSKCHGTR